MKLFHVGFLVATAVQLAVLGIALLGGQLSPVLGEALSLLYWTLGESLFRTKAGASMEPPKDKAANMAVEANHRSTFRNFAATTILHITPALFYFVIPPHFRLSTASVLAGLACGVLACWLRFSAMAALSESFTAGLRVAKDQKVIRTGVYAWVRHPGYLANLIIFTASSTLVSQNWWCILFTIVVFAYVWHLRIVAEEKLLRTTLPDYAVYSRDVQSRLLPGIY
jgi:protein-S-isoprenylcysteine O-methyltransferase Ste14